MSDYFLTEERPPEEPRRRPRWVDAAGLGAVVAVILAVGVLGDPGPREAAPDTTTTTERTPRRVDYDDRPSTTTTLPVTTTTAPVELGRSLTVETDTVLLLEGGGSMWTLDIDTGTLRGVGRSSNGGLIVPLAGGFLAMGQDGVEVLPLAGEPRRFSEDVRGWAEPMPDPSGTVWLRTERDSGASEYRADGTRTGRSVEIPPTAYVAGVVEQGLVVSQVGSIALVDPDDGTTRSLGHGEVYAAQGRTVVRMVCEALRCRLEAVDTRTRRARAIAGAPVDGFRNDRGRFSPDGRFFAYAWGASNGSPELVVLDLERGTRVDIGQHRNAAVEFSVAGGQLFVFSDLTLRAYDLATGTWEVVVAPGNGILPQRMTATRAG